MLALVQLVSVRLLTQNLGLQNYAVFALLAGLQGWFLLADAGVGVSAQNHVSEYRATGRSPQKVIGAARLLAVLLLVSTTAILYVAAPRVAPRLLHNFHQLADAERTRLFLATGMLSIGAGIGSLVYKLWYAEQRGYLSNLLPSLAALTGLVGVWLAGALPPDLRLEASLIAFMAPTALLPLGFLAFQVWKDGKTGAERLDRKTVGAILKRALGFWIFALMAALTLQIDYVVLAQFLGADDIALYALSTKVYGLTFFVYNALIMALWPVFAELIAGRRWAEIRRYLVRYLTAGMLFMAGCTVAMTGLMPLALAALAPSQSLRLPVTLVLLLGAYQIVRVWSDTFSMLLQSMSRLRPFWLLVPVQAALSAGLQWTLAPKYGLYGIVIGLMVSFLLTVVWGLPLAAHLYSRRDAPVVP